MILAQDPEFGSRPFTLVSAPFSVRQRCFQLCAFSPSHRFHRPVSGCGQCRMLAVPCAQTAVDVQRVELVMAGMPMTSSLQVIRSMEVLGVSKGLATLPKMRWVMLSALQLLGSATPFLTRIKNGKGHKLRSYILIQKATSKL